MMKTSETTNTEELYYIQCGYVGNSMLWWGIDAKGYTTNLKKAGKFPKDEAMRIINNRPEEESAWLCSHIDGCTEAQVLTVEDRKLDYDFHVNGKRE